MSKSYQVSLTGITPLLMHRDNLEFKAEVEKWQRAPENNNKSVAGDDRSPAWGWIGSLYHNGKQIALPTDALMASCMGAGAEVKAPRGKKSLKAQTQSGMAFMQPHLPLSVNGGSLIEMDDITTLKGNEDFDQHMMKVRALKFDLDIRRARIGTSKHVRVRPVFESWRASGTLNVCDDMLTQQALETIFYIAGDKYGLLEWRPSGRRPGPYGRFRAELKEV